MNFSEALKEVKDGYHAYRTGWMTKGALIRMVHGRIPHIEYHTPSGGKPYMAVSDDMLAEDWELSV